MIVKALVSAKKKIKHFFCQMALIDVYKRQLYAYAVDNAGNRSGYICTDGFVTDWTRPVVNLEDRKSTDVTTDLAYSFSEECTYELSLIHI